MGAGTSVNVPANACTLLYINNRPNYFLYVNNGAEMLGISVLATAAAIYTMVWLL